MSFFSGKKKHYVDTQVQRIVPDDQLKNTQVNGMVSAILRGGDIMSGLRDYTMGGGYRNFERYYKYAAKVGGYHYGIPNTVIHSSNAGDGTVELEIEEEIGEAVNMVYSYFRPLNNIHMGWKHLHENMQYDDSTNIIGTKTTEKGFDVYLDGMTALIETATGLEPDLEAYDVWGPSPWSGVTPERPAGFPTLSTERHILINDQLTEGVRIHYVWLDGNGAVQKEYIDVDLSAYDTDQEYYQAKYTKVSDGSVGYWTYDPFDQNAPNQTLNGLFRKPPSITPGEYFPFVVFRSEGVNRADPQYHATNPYLTTVELLDHLNMDFQQMADAMHDAGNDIHLVDQAVMMMGVPLNSTDETEIEYLYRFFDWLYNNVPVAAQGSAYRPADQAGLFESGYGMDTPTWLGYGVEWTDADFSTRLRFDSVDRVVKAGSIGPVGTYTAGVLGEYSNELGDLLEFKPSLVGADYTDVLKRSVKYFRYQQTESTYVELQLFNPNIRYHIFDTLGSEGNAFDDKALIPISKAIADQMSKFKVETLYLRSMHFVFNSHQTQKVSWYETGVFKAFLTIVAVVVTIWVSPELGAEFLAAVKALDVAAIAIILIEAIVTTVVIGEVVAIIFEEVVNILGEDVATALAVLTVIYGGYKAFTEGLIQGGTAVKMLQLSQGLTQGISDMYVEKMKSLLGEIREFDLLAQEQWDELEKINELFDTAITINPYDFIGYQPLFLIESPNQYFNRTIHSGNAGVKSLQLIENYVDLALKLPEPNETLGSLVNNV